MADDPINQQQFADDVAAATGEDGFMNFADADGNMNMPSAEEVWRMIEQMEGLSDEDRAALKDSLYNPQGSPAQEYLKRFAEPAAAALGHHTSWDYMIFLAMIVVLFLIFALFGYKLYKSLMEKELKKQEKLKQKQSKKSKKAN